MSTENIRRRLLALLGSAPLWPVIAKAKPVEASATLTGDQFMALSRFATAGATLDPEIGAGLLAALRESDPSLPSAFGALGQQAASGNYPDVEALEAALRETSLHAPLLALIAAWYTGTVTVKGKPRVVTMQGALMYEPIADGSHIPGNCAGATNSWSTRERPALAAMPSR